MTDLRVALANAEYEINSLRQALVCAGQQLGWATKAGAFGAQIKPGAKVVIKPNWVLHKNRTEHGLRPLITQTVLLEAIVEQVLNTEATELIIGDAPLQSCNFEALVSGAEIDLLENKIKAKDTRFKGIRDFRRTKSSFVAGVMLQNREIQAVDDYILFDLGKDSLLEEVTMERAPFRVTNYPPEIMAQTHAPGRHQYLIARELIEADVVINCPKLKTHKKAGMTGALKNLVGINGNKEYLPHHRMGSPATGGDCYPVARYSKKWVERLLDKSNAADSHLVKQAIRLPLAILTRWARLTSDELGFEGAWHGNDTVWRMTLDLNRILLYGTINGTLDVTPQRKIINVMDAIQCGIGDGPLAAEPHNAGLVVVGESSAAVDVVGAEILGMLPSQLPTVSHAFDKMRFPVVTSTEERPTVIDRRGINVASKPQRYPSGWLHAVDPRGRKASPVGVMHSGRIQE